MINEDKLLLLKQLMSEMESAYYGGFRISTSKDDIEVVKWAIEVIEQENDYSQNQDSVNDLKNALKGHDLDNPY